MRRTIETAAIFSVALAFSSQAVAFGVPGQRSRTLDIQPFDLPAIHIFETWGGKIREIEAIGITVPHMSPTGWE